MVLFSSGTHQPAHEEGISEQLPSIARVADFAHGFSNFPVLEVLLFPLLRW
jgi:hypothetical protein